DEAAGPGAGHEQGNAVELEGCAGVARWPGMDGREKPGAFCRTEEQAIRWDARVAARDDAVDVGLLPDDVGLRAGAEAGRAVRRARVEKIRHVERHLVGRSGPLGDAPAAEVNTREARVRNDGPIGRALRLVATEP